MNEPAGLTLDQRIHWYIGMLEDDGQIRGATAQDQLIAIGVAESGLLNLAIGNNALNGTPVTSPAFYDLGLGWLQHDTYWLRRETEVNGLVWSMQAIRSDVVESVRLLFSRPGFIVWQSAERTYLDWKYWATYPIQADGHLDRIRDVRASA